MPFNRQSIESVAKIGLRLHSLSKLVYSQSQGTDLLERKKLTKLTVDKILERISENMGQLSAKSHVEYINRENAFAKRGGCIFHAHHLSKWANDDPKKFFRTADKYESYGNRRYIEIEFALPNEFTRRFA